MASVLFPQVLISQVWCFGDLSDDLSDAQIIKIVADLFRISYSYLFRRVHVKPKLKGVSRPILGV